MKIEFETYVILVSFITSFFAVFLSNGIIIGVPAIAQDYSKLGAYNIIFSSGRIYGSGRSNFRKIRS